MPAKRGPKPTESQFTERVHIALTEAQLTQVNKWSKKLGIDRSKVFRTALANMEHQFTFDEMVKRLEGNLRSRRTSTSPRANKEALEAAKELKLFLKHHDTQIRVATLQGQLFGLVGFVPGDDADDLRKTLESEMGTYFGDWQRLVDACAAKLKSGLRSGSNADVVEVMKSLNSLMDDETTIKTIAMASTHRARYAIAVVQACIGSFAKVLLETEERIKFLEANGDSIPETPEPPPKSKRRLWPF